MKQVIIIRADLKMGKGKIASQAAHASVSAFMKAKEEDRQKWINEGMKKIVLKVSGEKELVSVYNRFKRRKLPAVIISDMGLTQVSRGTKTAVGCGPVEDSKIDKVTEKMKLL